MNAVVTNVARQRVAIDDIKPYPAMQPSGVEWLGDVPAHWERRKLRQILTPISERNRPDLPLLSVVRERGVILRNVDSRAENHNVVPEDLTNYKVVQVGHFAMNKMKAWQGSYGVSRFHGLVSPAYFVFDLSSVWPHFFHVAIRSRAYVPSFIQASDGVRIGQWDLSQDQMKEIPFFIPSPPEQAAIVRYLDYVDRRISRYIRAKQRLIDLLEEEKQAIIHRAVTRGLDPNVRLKPSGVEWLGDVPEHWELRRSRYVFQEVDRRSTEGQETHLSMSQKLGLIPSSRIEGWRLVAESYVGAKLCEPGDIVLNRLKAHLGVFALASDAGLVSADYTVLRPRIEADSRYFEAVYRTTSCRVELRKRTKGIVEGFWRLYTPDFFEVRVPVPPVAEQLAITLYLDAALGDVDRSVERIWSELTLLSEYRTRLIADVVTGKLDVREAATDLPEADPADRENKVEIDGVVADDFGAELEEVAP